jgi:excisionase family DNA binding protein
MQEKMFYTPEDVANMLELTVDTIRRYIREGKLPAIRLEGTYRIQREDFERFIEERKTVRPNN